MARVVVSLLAQADTDYIATNLTDKAGHRVAAKYTASFEALYERLAAHPGSGAPRTSIGRHVRIGIASPYIVIYEHDKASDTVTIFRIVHGRRRITGKMLMTGDNHP
jgi:toxin ParE1/3/4